MRWLAAAFLWITFLCLSGCGVSWSSQQPAPPWTTGFWFWQGSSTREAWSRKPVDVLFVQVGTIREPARPGLRRPTGIEKSPWYISGTWPRDVPDAKEYWFVFRYENQGVPDVEAAPTLAQEVSRLWDETKKANLKVAGVQLDIDSPTGDLPKYASFLREFKKGLPQGCQISITALLDWFRSGTAIERVTQEVDEFVPQFYDVNTSSDYPAGEISIAARIDAARWGPVFNRFGKRFRIGISSFGRARMVQDEAGTQSRYRGIRFFGDLKPIDLAINRAFELQTTRNQANELVLTYRAKQRCRIGYTDFAPGESVEFILATPESVRAAAGSVREMKGNLEGVLFFRWPSDQEVLAMQPEEVLLAAGLSGNADRERNRISAIDGHCAAVACVDIYLEGSAPFSPKPVRYRIHSSKELEYFLPEKNLPIRMGGASELDVSLPPYCARGRLYLGRAVTRNHSEFTVEEAQ